MINIAMNVKKNQQKPLCDIFGECGGCLYQDVTYEEELKIKAELLKELLKEVVSDQNIIRPIVPSPKHYHYRNRLDLKLKRTKENKVFIGFSPKQRKNVIELNKCFIAREEISDFIPELKRQAIAKLPPEKYRQANLVVRSGDQRKVFWGGIGRRSLEMEEKDYFWTEVNGFKLFYSLETFFQANLSILPDFLKCLTSFDFWEKKPTFYDLYGGVGLFSIGLYPYINKAYLIEESVSSIKLAQFNVKYHNFKNIEIIAGKVEDNLYNLIEQDKAQTKVAMIDPPRCGLSDSAKEMLSTQKGVDYMLYLSCNPEALARDLKAFQKNKWTMEAVVPFDFFPRTQHLETLVVLKSY